MEHGGCHGGCSVLQRFLFLEHFGKWNMVVHDVMLSFFIFQTFRKMKHGCSWLLTFLKKEKQNSRI